MSMSRVCGAGGGEYGQGLWPSVHGNIVTPHYLFASFQDTSAEYYDNVSHSEAMEIQVDNSYQPVMFPFICRTEYISKKERVLIT